MVWLIRLSLFLFALRGWGHDVAVTVDVANVVASFRSPPLGININPLMDAASKRPPGSPSLATILRNLGLTSLRFPEGELGDSYLWTDSPFPPLPAVRPRWALRGPDFWPSNDLRFSTPEFEPRQDITGPDEFLRVAADSGAEPCLIVAYDSACKVVPAGSHRPHVEDLVRSAAASVRHSRKVPGLSVRHWEIGNETDIVPPAYSGDDPGAEVYARDVTAFSTAMRAKDPGIRLGINVWSNKRLKELLAIPDLWPHVNFISLHNYPAFRWEQGYGYFQKEQVDLTETLRDADSLVSNSDLPQAIKDRLEFRISETSLIDWAKEPK